MDFYGIACLLGHVGNVIITLLPHDNGHILPFFKYIPMMCHLGNEALRGAGSDLPSEQVVFIIRHLVAGIGGLRQPSIGIITIGNAQPRGVGLPCHLPQSSYW